MPAKAGMTGGMLPELLRHPIRALRTPAVGAVGGDVVAVLYHHQLDRSLHLARQAFGVLGRHDAIEPPVHDENGTGYVSRDAFQRQRAGVLARLLLRLAMAAHAERFARQFRQSVPGRAPVERAAERDAGLNALVEGGG